MSELVVPAIIVLFFLVVCARHRFHCCFDETNVAQGNRSEWRPPHRQKWLVLFQLELTQLLFVDFSLTLSH